MTKTEIIEEKFEKILIKSCNLELINAYIELKEEYYRITQLAIKALEEKVS